MNVSDHCRSYIQKHINTCYSIIGSTISYKAKFRKVHDASLRIIVELSDGSSQAAQANLKREAKTQKMDTEQDWPIGGYLME